MALESSAAANAGTLATAGAMLSSALALVVREALRGRRTRREKTAIELVGEKIDDARRESESQTNNLERRLRAVARRQRRFIQEQTQLNAEQDRKIRGAYGHLIGEDGKNGQRSRIEDLEKWQEEVDKRERDRLSPQQVGSFHPPRNQSINRESL
jgi:hypothetical protein